LITLGAKSQWYYPYPDRELNLAANRYLLLSPPALRT
jgi:hypothetical protein